MRRIIDSSHSPEKTRPHIGHYGHLRKAYLEGYRPDLYAALIASERLYEHCAEIEDAARSRLDIIIPRLAASVGATEALKAQDPMKWVGLMNACKAQAEEIVKFELIYDKGGTAWITVTLCGLSARTASPLKSSSTTLLKPPFHIFFFSRMMIQTSIYG